ncbi:MAG: hypothetical protein FWB76_06950 [Oscillospiraceae bacterium]|nr:hypothetical protein [Oscillospiraceae bacterium]
MKKVLALIAAFAMIFSLGIVLTACGNDNGNDNDYGYPNELASCCTPDYDCECPDYPYCEDDCDCPTHAANDNDNDNENENDVLAADADPADDNDNDNDNDNEEEPEPVDPFLPPANLNTLSQAAQLEYFNLVANRVRTERPGFDRRNRLLLGNIRLSGAAAIANPIIRPIQNSLMPGNWEYQTYTPGTDNREEFFSNAAQASSLRPGDITSISSVAGANGSWTITVRIREEINPMPGMASANGRINNILSPQSVLDEITNISSAISADVEDATLRYHDAFATVTVNAQGQVTAASSGFNVDANAERVSIGPIRTNVSAPQETRLYFTNFVWR